MPQQGRGVGNAEGMRLAEVGCAERNRNSVQAMAGEPTPSLLAVPEDMQPMQTEHHALGHDPRFAESTRVAGVHPLRSETGCQPGNNFCIREHLMPWQPLDRW